MITSSIIIFLIRMNLLPLQDGDCEMWFKRLGTDDNGRVTLNRNPPRISGLRAGTTVQDSAGPYGDIFLTTVVSDNDKIVCFKVVKGDSVLLPKVKRYLSKQTVISAEAYGRKVYALYPFRLQFVALSKNKRKKNK